jgi:hypothetical protein
MHRRRRPALRRRLEDGVANLLVVAATSFLWRGIRLGAFFRFSFCNRGTHAQGGGARRRGRLLGRRSRSRKRTRSHPGGQATDASVIRDRESELMQWGTGGDFIAHGSASPSAPRDRSQGWPSSAHFVPLFSGVSAEMFSQTVTRAAITPDRPFVGYERAKTRCSNVRLPANLTR